MMRNQTLPFARTRSLAIAIGCLTVAVTSPTALADNKTDSAPVESARVEPATSEARIDAVAAKIDRQLAAAWQAADVTASEVCDDATFIRRLFLDVCGRIPTAAERSEFLNDSAPEKRAIWIDRLVGSAEYANHFADIFDGMLLGRSRRAMSRRQEHGWHDYLRDAFAENRPWDQMARDIVVARKTDGTDVRAGWYLYEHRERHQEMAESVARDFFGIRIECAQCHDHPLASEILQYHYWSLVSVFSRSENQRTDNGPRVAEKALGGFLKYTDLAGDSYEADLTFFDSPIVEEPRPEEDREETEDDYRSDAGEEPPVPKFSRRQEFADKILAEHPMVARALVNRMWALIMGRGIVHPFDRMDSMHDASHPDLLEAMADDFRHSGYDVQRLTRILLRTRCYQLKSQPASDSALPNDFAYAITKPLPAESLLRSIYVALSGEVVDPDRELMQAFRENFPSILPDEPNAQLSQALLITNHPELNELIARPDGTLEQLLELSTARQQAKLAFERVLGRRPDSEELAAAVAFLNGRPAPSGAQADSSGDSESHDAGAATRSKEVSISVRQAATAARPDAVVGDRSRAAQLLWALIASAEFRLNH